MGRDLARSAALHVAGPVAVLLVAQQAAQLAPLLAVIFFFLWGFTFLLDAAVTDLLYRASRRAFRRGETNRIFAALAERVGLPRAFAVHFLAVELPLFAFLSLSVAPALGGFMAGEATPLSCLGSGAAVLSYSHFCGWKVTAETVRRLRRRAEGV